MDPCDVGAADGSVVVDQLWKRRLKQLIADTPLPASLHEAVHTLPDIDLEDMEAIIDGQREAWGDVLHLPAGRFRLPTTYPLDFAIAIHVYTLEDPHVYGVVNRAMFNPARRQPGTPTTASGELLACMPFIKFLDAALEALPPSYVFRGRVRRGVKWVFPSPEHHDPEAYFTPGTKLCWYEFKSTSTEQEVMTRPHFCGVEPGPRTIFAVQACHAYDIQTFSYYQAERSEFEVLFRPLSIFEVVHAQKNIIDPSNTTSLERSGFPDTIALEQIDETPSDGATAAVATAAASALVVNVSSEADASISRAVVDEDVVAHTALLRSSTLGARKQVESAIAMLADAPPEVTNDPMRAALANAGVIELLQAMLSDGTAGERAKAAEALLKLARKTDNQVAIAAAGGIAPLVELVRSGSAEGKANAAGALWHLAFNADNQVAIVALGRMPVELA